MQTNQKNNEYHVLVVSKAFDELWLICLSGEHYDKLIRASTASIIDALCASFHTCVPRLANSTD